MEVIRLWLVIVETIQGKGAEGGKGRPKTEPQNCRRGKGKGNRERVANEQCGPAKPRGRTVFVSQQRAGIIG